ncbi:MAG TPA: D-aminoacyl-tRNA deacylase [Desulfuromonadales bacterium]|nr:D-aminoacyl-tRNA deacylase [Desulfuromonadales bacterium]
MKAVLQRVAEARVEVDGEIVGKVGRGLLVLLGVEQQDTNRDLAYLADKTLNLRIFEDAAGKMNLSVAEIDGEVLVVSQFTLLGDCRKGRRPGFTRAAEPELADDLYRRFVDRLLQAGLPVATGTFRAHMQVALINDGPVTMLLDSRKEF